MSEIHTPSQSSDPYPRHWSLEFPDPETWIAQSRTFSAEEIHEYGAYAMHWLYDKLGDRATGVVTVRNNREDAQLPGRQIYESQQQWGSVDPAAVTEAGLSIEFGGPTRFKPGNILPHHTPDFVSNITTDQEINNKGQRVLGSVDFLADAGQMPVASESLGSVVVSDLPDITGFPDDFADGTRDSWRNLRERAITEAERVIKPGGYLIWNGGRKEDFDQITQLGLQPLSLNVIHSVIHEPISNTYTDPTMHVNGVYQKPELQVY